MKKGNPSYIFILRGDLINPTSGTEKYARILFDELTKKGIKVLVLGGSYRKNSEYASHENVINNYLLKGRYLVDDILLFISITRNLLISEKTFSEIIYFGPGVSLVGLINSLMYRNIRHKATYYAIDCMVDEYEGKKQLTKDLPFFNKIRNFIKYNYLIFSEKYFSKISNKVLCSCKYTQQKFIERYNIHRKKTKVLYFGINDTYSFGVTSRQAENILFVVTDHLRKGTSIVIGAAKILKDKYKFRKKIIIAGEPNDQVKRLAKEFNSPVIFLGQLDLPNLKRQYSRARILISPSVSEGFCMPLIEALSFGVPCIVSAVGSQTEIIKQGINGLIMRSNTPETLATDINQILTNKKLYQRLHKYAQSSVEKFYISKISQQLINLA